MCSFNSSGRLSIVVSVSGTVLPLVVNVNVDFDKNEIIVSPMAQSGKAEALSSDQRSAALFGSCRALLSEDH